MVKHVLFVKLKDYTPENAQALCEKFLTMRGNVPVAIEVNSYADFLRSERSFDVILEVTLESREALEEYQRDEFHCNEIKTYVQGVRSASAAVDYEF
ncbi:MAG: stress responsive protein [Clostridiales bacterium]|nr:MAG: stress responsive protein [Clostridiales bacterium]